MTDPAPVLSYATPQPKRRRPRSATDHSARTFAAAQVGLAGLSSVALFLTPVEFSAGSWAAWFAWHWFVQGIIVLYAVAAFVGARGAFRPRGQRRKPSLVYAGLSAANLCVTLAAMIALGHLQLYVTDNPSAPAVNDHRFTLDFYLVQIPVLLLACNPLLILFAVRFVLRPWATLGLSETA